MEDVNNKFLTVKQLIDNSDKLDTETEPHKSKYAAIEILKDLETELKAALQNDTESQVLKNKLAVTYFILGKLYIDTEELKAGEEKFMSCLELLKDRELDAECILPTIRALNHLGLVWSQWNEPLKAQIYLEKAEQLYKDYTDPNEPREDPISMNKIFDCEDDKEPSPRTLLDKLHTLTLYYLAQVWGLFKDDKKSAMYCHMTLKRQLGETEVADDLDYIEWALNAATLSQYFMENGENFSQAIHHLSAATYILQKYEDILKKRDEVEGTNEALSADWENFKHRSADVARCWAKYGIVLLSTSEQRLLQRSERDEALDAKNEANSKDESQTFSENLKFEILEKELKVITSQITDKYLLDFSDARPVFLNAQSWLEEAKKYYTLENHASDYVQIEQDLSQTFKHLAFFEESEERQAKMHKRRVDILENVVSELNPQYYQDACRQIWMELGETYSDILDIKLDRLRVTEEKPSPHQLSKINHLTRNAIQNFQAFLNSVKTKDSDLQTMQLPDDLLQPVLRAHFHLGRLHNKVITPDKAAQLENTQNSLNAYKFIVDYCGKCPKAAEVMKVELNICEELVTLLPMKIERLRRDISS